MYGKISSAFSPLSVGEKERQKAIKPRVPFGSNEPIFKYEMNYNNIKRNNAIVKKNTVSEDTEPIEPGAIVGGAIVFIFIAIALL